MRDPHDLDRFRDHFGGDLLRDWGGLRAFWRDRMEESVLLQKFPRDVLDARAAGHAALMRIIR